MQAPSLLDFDHRFSELGSPLPATASKGAISNNYGSGGSALSPHLASSTLKDRLGAHCSPRLVLRPMDRRDWDLQKLRERRFARLRSPDIRAAAKAQLSAEEGVTVPPHGFSGSKLSLTLPFDGLDARTDKAELLRQALGAVKIVQGKIKVQSTRKLPQTIAGQPDGSKSSFSVRGGSPSRKHRYKWPLSSP